jgi:hypothetical protein
MISRYVVLGLLIHLFLFNSLCAQKITVSNEISVRNNFSYDILPNIGDHIIFFHDRGFEQNFEIYDNELRYKTLRQPEFEKKNIKPLGVLPRDSSFNFYYYFTDEGKYFIRVNTYDKYVSLLDSATLVSKEKSFFQSNPRFTFSKDTSKVLIYTPEEKNMRLQLVDNINLKTIFEFTLSVKDFNFRTDFEKILVSNEGEIFIVGRESSFWNKNDDEGFTLLNVKSPEYITVHKFTPESNRITDLLMDYDEKNKKLAFGGLISPNSDYNSIGYFGFSITPKTIPLDAEIIINKFSLEFIADVTGKKVGKSKELSYFKIRDMVIRNDGGVILISELIKEFTRRAQMNNPGQFGTYFPPRGFIDYYHEDLILLTTFANGNEHWKKILFKKQFSQDDDGIYSSYFVFKTPSRLRLIYNDEIKSNNTVSEYVIDGLGNFERKSILSTEYQNLKLRFRNAIQTGSNSFIVPSEKSWKINLVKIDYSQ